MAKYSDKQNAEAKGLLAGIEKFRLYAEPRGIELIESTYGLYKVVRGKRSSVREAVEAAKIEDENVIKGWVINLGGKQRKFVTAADGYKVF